MAQNLKDKKESEIIKLNHFIKLEYLLVALENRALSLTDGRSWDDKNDTEVLKEYKKAKGYKKLFALCCLSEDETIHHWNRYTDKEIGCCIEFDGPELIEHMAKTKNLKQGLVQYKKLKEVKKGAVELDAYPFVKRWPYRYEKEYRFIWGGDHNSEIFPVGIDLALIHRITLLSKKSDAEVDKVIDDARHEIQKRLKGNKIRVSHSTVFRNNDWINKFKR